MMRKDKRVTWSFCVTCYSTFLQVLEDSVKAYISFQSTYILKYWQDHIDKDKLYAISYITYHISYITYHKVK